MTSSHENEPLAEAIFFVLRCAYPDEGYEEDCGSTLGIAIGSPSSAAEIRDAFSNLERFIKCQLEAEADQTNNGPGNKCD